MVHGSQEYGKLARTLPLSNKIRVSTKQSNTFARLSFACLIE